MHMGVAKERIQDPPSLLPPWITDTRRRRTHRETTALQSDAVYGPSASLVRHSDTQASDQVRGPR